MDLRAARATLATSAGPVGMFRLAWLVEEGLGDPGRLPHTVKILLENILRHAASGAAEEGAVLELARWPRGSLPEFGFVPARILMQDFTGVPAVVDLAAMRSALARAGGDPFLVNLSIPADLVIDHSVQVDRFGGPDAYSANLEWEYRRNEERYGLLRWAQHAFDGFRVVPPGMGICHQVNLEHLAQVVQVRGGVAFPDTVLGTDSHTTMVNGLGVLGWGVGGIEAEAAMLGRSLSMPWPVVTGVRLRGELPGGSTATDLVLTLTQMLRAHGVVGKFVEFFGEGPSGLPVPDRATLSNMAPEYGATAALFPVDHQTLRYLRETGREALVDLVERYTKEQGLFRTDADPAPQFTEVLELDLGSVEPTLAGPRRPQDRVPLAAVPRSFSEAHPAARRAEAESVGDGSVVIAAITSCTNTSNPKVMVAAGLLGRNAVEAGLQSKPWVKTSLAPGSRVVSDYLDRAGLTPYLEKLGFSLVGYGCTTCIGNSGPLPDDVARQVQERDLTVVAVLSGNRNFDGRIHPLVRASYLGSPPLCIAYALAGRIDIDLTSEPLGQSENGSPVYLRDIWPSPDEIDRTVASVVSPEQFEREYARVFQGDERWRGLAAPTGPLYEWDPDSTYVREPPFFDGIDDVPPRPGRIEGARALVVLGDSVTTDHISPAGSIDPTSPAGQYLQEQGIDPRHFNSYGSRRGNHEVMVRGTFANARLRNALTEGREGPWTVHLPSGELMTIYEASCRYAGEGVPLLALAGKEYGSGSSRDWAAKGTALLGIRAVLAESYERIHRSNLVGMGVLPLQFLPGDSASSLGLSGRERFTIGEPEWGFSRAGEAAVEARNDEGRVIAFRAMVRIDSPAEAECYRRGGVLKLVLSELAPVRRSPL
jgi:aconitate hydratase